jgi:hypothetical protein
MILAEVSNKDVEAGVDNGLDLISKLWSGVEAFLNVIPPIVIGGIIFFAFVLWLFSKVRS